MEQLLRDCRITMIYEGTNGIQAMDLLGRKLGLNQGKPIMDLLVEIQKTLGEAKRIDALKGDAERVEKAVNRLGEVALHLGQTAMSPKVLYAFAYAHPFLDVCGDVVLAWLHLWRATVAAAALENGAKKKDLAFYEGQMKSAEFFIHTILPVTNGKMKAILETSGYLRGGIRRLTPQTASASIADLRRQSNLPPVLKRFKGTSSKNNRAKGYGLISFGIVHAALPARHFGETVVYYG